MISKYTELKKKIFNIKQFNDTINDYKETLFTLEPEEKVSIKRGRYKH
jgi:hypothetical protein